jgi:N4-gp56 family major capsid protein
MANDYISGMLWSDTLPSWQRDYYSMLLLETLRTKSILVPFTTMKEDYAAGNSGVIVFTEVYDTEPNWNPLAETDIWLQGAHLDSRTVRIELEIHGDTLKFSDYNEVVQYVNAGNMRGLVRDKIGINQRDYLDILARNAFLSTPYKTFAGSKADRASLIATDYFNPDIVETVRVHLEENEIPGVVGTMDGDQPTIACVTTPRVIKDIRTAEGTSKWLEVIEYAGSSRKFTAEVGSWAGVRFIRTNRLRLRNHGAVTAQTALNGAAPAGSGAAATVDVVYSPGQSNSTRYITVDAHTDFSVGDWITIHSHTVSSAGEPPVEADGTQETRRIVSIDTGNNRFALNKPLLKDHADDNWVTKGVDVHASIFLGGPGVVYGVAERPRPTFPPKYDDLMMVNRIGWRGFLKFQLFRPEYFEVVESAGSTD